MNKFYTFWCEQLITRPSSITLQIVLSEPKIIPHMLNPVIVFWSLSLMDVLPPICKTVHKGHPIFRHFVLFFANNIFSYLGNIVLDLLPAFSKLSMVFLVAGTTAGEQTRDWMLDWNQEQTAGIIISFMWLWWMSAAKWRTPSAAIQSHLLWLAPGWLYSCLLAKHESARHIFSVSAAP